MAIGASRKSSGWPASADVSTLIRPDRGRRPFAHRRWLRRSILFTAKVGKLITGGEKYRGLTVPKF